MSAALEARAELTKLARLLELDVADIEYLALVPPPALRKLRDQVTDVLFGVDLGGLSRLASHSGILPPQLIAAITREAVGPLLTARFAGLVEVDMAVKVVTRLSPDFLADVAVAMDPRRAHAVLGAMPPEVVLPITKELAKRKEWIVMGAFVGHLDDETSRAALDSINDAGLLKIAFVMEDKSLLGHELSMLSDKRLNGVLKVAAKQKLWPEVLDLMMSLEGEQRTRVIDIVARQDALVLDSLIESIYEEDLWESVLNVVEFATDPTTIANAIVRAPAHVFAALIEAVDEFAMWASLVNLVGPVTRQLARRKEWTMMGDVVSHLDDATTLAALGEISDEGILRVAFAAGPTVQLGPRLALLSDERLSGVMQVAATKKLWPEAILLLVSLRGKHRKRVVDLVTNLDAAVLDSLIDSVQQNVLWGVVLGVVEEASDPTSFVDAATRTTAPAFRALVDAVEDGAMWESLRKVLSRVDERCRSRFFKRAAKLGVLERMVPLMDLVDAA